MKVHYTSMMDARESIASTACGIKIRRYPSNKYFPQVSVNAWWKYVTCERCLKQKPDDAPWEDQGDLTV